MFSGLSILGRFCHAPLRLGGLLGTSQKQVASPFGLVGLLATSQIQAVRNASGKKKKQEKPMKPPTINGTYVLKRKHRIRLHKVGALPRKLRKQDFVYRVEEVKQLTDPVKVVLRDVVLDIGVRGQVVDVPPLYAHEDLLLTGKAVYATKENLERYAEDIESSLSSVSAYFTQKRLSEFLLTVVMSAENPWELQKWHVRSAFRRAGVWMTDECITLPEHTIKGPNPDNPEQEFVVNVTINDREETAVQAKIRLYSSIIHSM